MKILITALKTSAVIAASILALLPIAIFLPDAGIAASCGMAALGVLSLKWPLKKIWLDNKFGSVAVIIVAGFGLHASAQSLAEHQIAVERQAKERKEARLAALRSANPGAYLEELKAEKDPRWESEFEALDRVGYVNFVAARKAKEEAERKDAIAKYLEQAKVTPNSDLETLQTIYSRLSDLEPSNRDFKNRRDALERQIGQRKEAQALLDLQRKYPHQYVQIENFSWSKGGFGSVMIANFSIKNNLPWAIKDIEVKCTHTAPSGTTIDQNRRTIFERIEANKSRRISNFSMGFIHSQASRSGCDIVDVIAIR